MSLTTGSAFVVGVLATWRVSRLVAREDGPFDVVLRLRTRAGTSMVGRLMDCPYCVSVWAALPLAGWLTRRAGLRAVDSVPIWLALSGGACLLEQALPGRAESPGFEIIAEPPADERRNDGLLP